MAKICYRDELHLSSKNVERLEVINEIIEEYAAQGYKLTLRQLYYQLVSKDIIPNKKTEYAKLSHLLKNGRMAGVVDFEAIEDRIRVPKRPYWVTGIPDALNDTIKQYRLNRQEGQDVYIECFSEKDAISNILYRITKYYHIYLVINRGYSSCTAMHDAHKRFEKHDNNVILYLGDHDPSGLDMIRDIKDRLEEFGSTPEVVPVALTTSQVRQYDPPPNPAKALALTTPIATPTGWTTIQDIHIGDFLFADDGSICRVLKKSEIFIGKDCFEFTFACGEKIISSADHLWCVDARKRKGGIITTDQIASTWKEGKIERPVYRVHIAKPLILPKIDLPIPPYTLGAWLGDGYSEGYTLACSIKDNEILEYIKKDGFKVKRLNHIRCGISGLCKYLRQEKLHMNKHIPNKYLRSSYEQRLALLQGLMDTDGTIADENYRPKNKKSLACSFSSSRKHLAEQVLELLCSLGIRGNLSECRAIIDKKDVGATWRVEFYPDDIDVFRLIRKRKKLNGSKANIRQKWRTIINVRKIESVPTQCLIVDSKNHLFLVGYQLIPTHNSTDPRAKWYTDIYGDTSWEVDALEPDVLHSLLREQIESRIDMNMFYDILDQEREDIEELRTIVT